MQQFFDSFGMMLEGMGQAKYYLLIVPGFMVLSLVFGMIYKKKQGNQAAKFREENPNASSILLQTGGTYVTPHSMTLHSIEGHESIFEVNKKGQFVYWLRPGSHTLEVSYVKSRPGVLHKRVTTTYGPAKLTVQVESGRSYALSFNKDEQFVFTQI